jgi:DNA-binding beta-propeller fold protein YncE
LGVLALGKRCPRLAGRSAAVFCALLGTSLLASSPALALSQRGHVFSFGFGFLHPAGVAVSDATGDVYVTDTGQKRLDVFEPVLNGTELVNEKALRETKVTSPGAIAVDNSTEGTDPSSGDVYVVTGAHTIEKLGAKGEPVATIKGFKLGAAKETRFASIENIAIDATGQLFVYQQDGTIYRFNDAMTNEGESEVVVPPGSEDTPPLRSGFAVDASDNFYLGESAMSEGLVGSPLGLLLTEEEASLNNAREAAGEVVVKSYTVAAKREAGTGKILIPALDYEFASAFAVNLASGPANEVAERNDVYVVNVAGTGSEKTSTVAEFGPEESDNGEHETGEPIQRFGAPSLKEGDAIAVDAATGTVYVADAVSDDVDVFELEGVGAPTVEGVSATSSATLSDSETLTAKIDPVGAATEYYFEYGTESCTSTRTCAKTAPVQVGEGFGSHTVTLELPSLSPGTYYYRVVAENADGKARSPEQTFTEIASLGLLPDGRAWEMVSPPDKAGAEPEAIRRAGGTIQASANGDALTYAADGPMPAGTEVEGNRGPEVNQILSTREPGQAAWSSRDITTPNETGAGPDPGSAEEYRLFSTTLALALVEPYPGVSGPFASPPLAPLMKEAGESAKEEEGPQENTPYIRDDSQLTPEASEQADYTAAREDGEAMDNPGYVPLVTKLNAPGPAFGRTIAGRDKFGILPEAATPDLSHVVFLSANPNGAEGLYEWAKTATGGKVSKSENQLVSVLEDGTRVRKEEEAWVGSDVNNFDEPDDVRHAISNNGDRVFWTYKETEEEGKEAVHLEVRETGETASAETLQLDKVLGGTGNNKNARAVFQTASADGSKVFFTDNERLTPESGAQEQRPDLYVAEITIRAGHLTLASLTDLTALRDEGADIVMLERNERGGGVMGASEDGSYVYFVANGVLAPGAARGHCEGPKDAARPAGTTCNLYVRHYDEATEEWEPTRFIAALSSEDAPDWGIVAPGDFGYLTARVSPDGSYLAFMSERSLTGYDNEDMSSKRKGERLDEEVFLYHARHDSEPESLVCASCNPTGARPSGVFDPGLTLGGTAEGLGLVVDRTEIWSVHTSEEGHAAVDHWLAGNIPGWTNSGENTAQWQSRYLSDSGRLFFDSADPLVPLATPLRNEMVEGDEQNVGVENVYEYEPGSVGGCGSAGGCVGLISSGASPHESAFIEASESGNDVFFLTAERLAPQDFDTNFDIYDAHVCEAGSPCPSAVTPPREKCEESDTCQGSEAPYSPGSAAEASGTAVFSGAGNLVLPKQEVLPEKKVVSPVLTRAQKLAKALKACRKDKKKSKRLVCEKQARKSYRPSTSNAKNAADDRKSR